MRRARCLLPIVLLAACATSAPLVDPPAISALPTAALTRTAILRGLIHERFVVDSEQPGRVRARFQPGWLMTVEIDYASEVAIHYAGSRLMGYEVRDGVPYIHNGYNRRAQRLCDAIAREARLILAEVDPDAFLGPPVSAPPPEKSEAAR